MIGVIWEMPERNGNLWRLEVVTYRSPASKGIAAQGLLHDQRQALHALLHIGMAHRDPHPRTRWDHRSAFSAAAANAGDADGKIVTLRPRGRSITNAAPISGIAAP